MLTGNFFPRCIVYLQMFGVIKRYSTEPWDNVLKWTLATWFWTSLQGTVGKNWYKTQLVLVSLLIIPWQNKKYERLPIVEELIVFSFQPVMWPKYIFDFLMFFVYVLAYSNWINNGFHCGIFLGILSHALIIFSIIFPSSFLSSISKTACYQENKWQHSLVRILIKRNSETCKLVRPLQEDEGSPPTKH